MVDRQQVIATVLKTIAATLLVHVILVVILFGTVNPLGGFWGHRFPTATPITRIRKTQLFDAWQRQAPIQGLIVGASKSMKLAPKAFSQATGLRFFNFSLSAGTLEDVKIVMQLAEEKHARPREMVLGVDAQMLTRYGIADELTQDWEFARRLEERQPTIGWKLEHGAHLVREAMTPTFAQAVGTSIMAAINHREPLHHFYEDGYLDYLTRDRAIAAGRFPRAANIRRCTIEVVDSLRLQYPYDPHRMALLDSILDRARADSIRVTLWLTPYHPDVLTAVARYPQMAAWLRSVPDSLRKVAAAHGASFVNLQTIDLFDGDPNDFYDCVHFGNANAAKVTTHLLAARQLTTASTPASGAEHRP